LRACFSIPPVSDPRRSTTDRSSVATGCAAISSRSLATRPASTLTSGTRPRGAKTWPWRRPASTSSKRPSRWRRRYTARPWTCKSFLLRFVDSTTLWNETVKSKVLGEKRWPRASFRSFAKASRKHGAFLCRNAKKAVEASMAKKTANWTFQRAPVLIASGARTSADRQARITPRYNTQSARRRVACVRTRYLLFPFLSFVRMNSNARRAAVPFYSRRGSVRIRELAFGSPSASRARKPFFPLWSCWCRLNPGRDLWPSLGTRPAGRFAHRACCRAH